MLTTRSRNRVRSHSIRRAALFEGLESRVLLTTIDITLNGPLPIVTNDTTPSLSGTVSDPAASVSVFLGIHNGALLGQFSAFNHGNGTWTFTLPDASALADGHYDVLPFATHGQDSGANGFADSLIVDTAVPVVAFDPGQLPSARNSAVPLTGTFVEANLTGIVITADNGGGGIFTFNADINASAGTWTSPALMASLPVGSYSVSVTATDSAGNHTTIHGGGLLIIDNTPPVTSTTTVESNDASPALSGAVDDPTAAVTVTVKGATYPAINNGNGTWTLPDNTIAALPDGVYRLTVTATDPANNHGVFSGALLIIGAAAPVVRVNTLETSSTSPALSGTIDDPAATITVSVAGQTYAATNNGDGTWALSAGTILPLAQGTYDVSVSATDAFGNVGSDSTTNELSILSTQTITLGSSILKVSYTDADGTLVTVTSGKGSVALAFSGVSIVVGGTATAPVLTATGGIRQVDVHVLANTAGLTFKTSAAGDALTTIHSIDGAGVLTALTATTATLTNGINMTGYIQSVQLNSIESNITMGSFPKGVSIVANTFLNSTIHVPFINVFTAKLGYQAASVIATSIGPVLLSNVKVSNGGTHFGLTATTIRSLKLTQAGVALTWKKNFLNSIVDFTVTG